MCISGDVPFVLWSFHGPVGINSPQVVPRLCLRIWGMLKIHISGTELSNSKKQGIKQQQIQEIFPQIVTVRGGGGGVVS